MDYISVKQAAEKWGISVRWVQVFLKENRILGAKRLNGYAWLIPADAEKPANPRFAKTPATEKTLSDDLETLIDMTIVSMPKDNPDAILDAFKEDRFRLHFEGELAYLRGDFERVIACFQRTRGDDAARLRACPLTIAAAISTGNYQLYTEIEAYSEAMIKADKGMNVSVLAGLSLDTAYVSAIAPNMVSNWVKSGDLSEFPDKVKPDAAYKRAKYFQGLGKFDAMLATAQTALSFCDAKDGISYIGIYLRLACAIASVALKQTDEAKRYLLDTMHISLPYGFITPFAESASAFGGLLEQLLKEEFPEHRDAIAKQWQRTFVNWISFHNHFTKDNITHILSMRNYEIASLVAHQIPYTEIAKKFNISVGRLNNIIGEIYGELFVSGKKELSSLIL